MPNFTFYSLDGEDVRLMLWDTAGQEEFDSLTSVYYRGVQTFLCPILHLQINLKC